MPDVVKPLQLAVLEIINGLDYYVRRYVKAYLLSLCEREGKSDMSELKSYAVWDATTRWFHWVNALCMFMLIALGIAILNASTLGVSTEGKILLKASHVWVGYVFTLNLFWRVIWAFIGSHYARWPSLLPGGKGYVRVVKRYAVAFVSGNPERYLGHNPLGRLAVFVLFVLMITQAVTGLVLAGTDLFYPPLGGWIANWIAAPGIAPDALVPYASAMYDAEAYQSMRAFRKPFITVHELNFFVLCAVTVVHIAAVVLTEISEEGGIISAMFSGKKTFSQTPLDVDNDFKS